MKEMDEEELKALGEVQSKYENQLDEIMDEIASRYQAEVQAVDEKTATEKRELLKEIRRREALLEEIRRREATPPPIRKKS